MKVINEIQEGLSVLQAIPVVGPLFFSLPKAAVSVAQIIAGLAIGVFCGTVAIASTFAGAHRTACAFTELAGEGFKEYFLGIGSLFYACLNMSTLGIAGLIIECTTRDISVLNTFGYPFSYR